MNYRDLLAPPSPLPRHQGYRLAISYPPLCGYWGFELGFACLHSRHFIIWVVSTAPTPAFFKGSLGDQFKRLVVFQQVLVLTSPEGGLPTRSDHQLPGLGVCASLLLTYLLPQNKIDLFSVKNQSQKPDSGYRLRILKQGMGKSQEFVKKHQTQKKKKIEFNVLFLSVNTLKIFPWVMCLFLKAQLV